MALQNFVDKVGPVVSAAWLNAVDRLKFTIFADAADKADARTALTLDAPLEVTNGGTGVRTVTALQTALGVDNALRSDLAAGIAALVKSSSIKYALTAGEILATIATVSDFQYQAMPFGAANVLRYGADLSGVTNSTNAFILALSANKMVFVPDGNYTLTVGTINLPVGAEIWLSPGATITVTAGSANYIFNCLGRNRIFGGKFVCSSDYAVVANVVGAITNVTLDRVETSGARLLRGNTTATTYATSNSGNSPRDIRVINCRAVWTITNTTLSCISLDYANDVLIAYNYVEGYYHGINWWGGNSSFAIDGLPLVNDRKAKRWKIIGNTVYNTNNGGIWGSMGEDITVTANIVTDHGDTGIDFEGCVNCGAYANTVRCTGTKSCNVLISTFFTCRGVVFSGNLVETAISTVPVYGHYNSSNNNTFGYDVSLLNNRFACTQTAIVANLLINSAIHSIKITGNKFYNINIVATGLAIHQVTINDNDMEFVGVTTTASAIAVSVYRDSTLFGTGTANVNGNRIYSDVLMPVASLGIYCEHNDGNSGCCYYVNDNDIFNFRADVVFKNQAAAGVIPRFLVCRNILRDASKFERYESGGANSVGYLENNRDEAALPYPNGAPGSFRWDLGQIVWRAAPTAGNPKGDACVLAGTPGTWDPIT